jgi:hypothetical protein
MSDRIKTADASFHERTDFETELGRLDRSHVSTRTCQRKGSFLHLAIQSKMNTPPPMTTASYCPEGVASPRVDRCQRPACNAAAEVCRASCDAVYGEAEDRVRPESGRILRGCSRILMLCG